MENELVILPNSELKLLIQKCIRIELANSIGAETAPDDILNSEDVLKLLKISPSHLIVLRKHGLPHYRLDYRHSFIRYRRYEILQWVGSHKVNYRRTKKTHTRDYSY